MVNAPAHLVWREISVGPMHNIVPSSLKAEKLDAAGESED